MVERAAHSVAFAFLYAAFWTFVQLELDLGQLPALVLLTLSLMLLMRGFPRLFR